MEMEDTHVLNRTNNTDEGCCDLLKLAEKTPETNKYTFVDNSKKFNKTQSSKVQFDISAEDNACRPLKRKISSTDSEKNILEQCDYPSVSSTEQRSQSSNRFFKRKLNETEGKKILVEKCIDPFDLSSQEDEPQTLYTLVERQLESAQHEKSEITKIHDPFDLSFDEDSSQEKYVPMKRKLNGMKNEHNVFENDKVDPFGLSREDKSPFQPSRNVSQQLIERHCDKTSVEIYKEPFGNSSVGSAQECHSFVKMGSVDFKCVNSLQDKLKETNEEDFSQKDNDAQNSVSDTITEFPTRKLSDTNCVKSLVEKSDMQVVDSLLTIIPAENKLMWENFETMDIHQEETVKRDVLFSTLQKKEQRKPNTVAYMFSEELLVKSNKLIRIEGREEKIRENLKCGTCSQPNQSIWNSKLYPVGPVGNIFLIKFEGLNQISEENTADQRLAKVKRVIAPRPATEMELTGFHSLDYINFLKAVSKMTDSEEIQEKSISDVEAFGLGYDCPIQNEIFETTNLICGASIIAAEKLLDGSANIAINWFGGWHHAKRDSASGFCYLNDIVLCILKLREKFDKVLYVDLDLHHGDGVEEAFAMTSKVMTVSFHKHAVGFFPGTGRVEDVGTGRGKFYSVNVPLMDGITDAQFFNIVQSVMKIVKEKFEAQALVIQCGADGLSEDTMASFNLTHLGIAKSVCFMLTWNLPTIILGGGGYNFPGTSKCWAFITALAAKLKLPADIPEHEHFLMYGPSYDLSMSLSNRKDCNSKEYLSSVISKVSGVGRRIPYKDFVYYYLSKH